MGQDSSEATKAAHSEEMKQLREVTNGKGPFSIGYGYVQFSGHKIDAAEVERFSISRGAGAVVIVAIVAFALATFFLKTRFTFINYLVTALLGANSFLLFINYIRPGGFRLLVMHMIDGRKLHAYVSFHTAQALTRYWDDIIIIMPEMLGRPSR